MDMENDDPSKLAYPEEEECAVCLESKQWLRDLPCHHCICETCLLNLIQNGEKTRTFLCPFCRASYSTDRSQLSCFGKQILLGKIRCENCNRFAPTRETMWCDRCGEAMCTDCALAFHKHHELFEWESAHVVNRILDYVRNHQRYQMQSVQAEKDRIRSEIHRMLDSVLDEIIADKWEKLTVSAGSQNSQSVKLGKFLNSVLEQKAQTTHVHAYSSPRSLHLGLIRLLQLLDVDEYYLGIADGMENVADLQLSCTLESLKSFLTEKIHVNVKQADKTNFHSIPSTFDQLSIPDTSAVANKEFEDTKTTLRNVMNYIAGPEHWKIRTSPRQGQWHCHVTLHHPTFKEFLGESSNKLEAEANASLMALLYLQDEGVLLEDFRLTSKFRDSSRSVKVKLDDHFDDNDAVELNGALSGYIVNEIELPMNFMTIKGIARHDNLIGIISSMKVAFIDTETNSITASYELQNIVDRRFRDYIHRFSNDSFKCITYSPKLRSFLVLAFITYDSDPWILFKFPIENAAVSVRKEDISQFHLPIAKWREGKIISNVVVLSSEEFLFVCCSWSDNFSEIRQVKIYGGEYEFESAKLLFHSNVIITQLAIAQSSQDQCVCYVIQGFDQKMLKIVKNSGDVCAIPHTLSTNISANSKLCVDYLYRAWVYDGLRRQIRCSRDDKTWISQAAREGILGIVSDGPGAGILAASIDNSRLSLLKFQMPETH